MDMFSATFVDRGASETWVYVPGWSTDGRLFDTCDKGRNRLVVDRFQPESFVADLKGFLDRSELSFVHFYGVSMGAFLVTDFVMTFPEMVGECVLVGLRPHYPEAEINKIIALFKRSPAAFLTSFYKSCFPNPEDYRSFMRRCGSAYVANPNTTQCLAGLGYLSRVSWSPDDWPVTIPLQVCHGTEDRIAPFSEISDLMVGDDRLRGVDGQGHLSLVGSWR